MSSIENPEAERPDSGSWRASSECRKHPTEWWFAGGYRETTLAKNICAGCVAQGPCLEFALGRPELLGVWAATTANERARMRRAPADTEARVAREAERTLALRLTPERERGRDRLHPDGLDDRPELLTAGEAARILGVTPNTVARWSRTGKVSAMHTMGGHRRFRRSEIERVLREGSIAPSTPM